MEMRDSEKRDVCIRKNLMQQRDVRRIPIICEQLKRLWVRYRRDNEATGFYTIICMLQSISYEQYELKYGIDPFFWEEDRWYDFIDNLIETKEGLSNPYLSMEQLNDMGKIVKFFEDFWMLFPDLRLWQVFDFLEDAVGEQLKFEILSVDFWKAVLGTHTIKVLETNLSDLKRRINSVGSEKSLIPMDTKTLFDLLNVEKTRIELKLNSLRKEYGI